MNLKARKSGPWQHTLEVEVPADEVVRRMDEVAQRVQPRASLPGFRPGKVPIGMVRQHFADTIEQEFLETFLPEVTGAAVDQARLNPAVRPIVRNLRFTPGQPLRFEAVVDVWPEVEVGDYKGMPVRRQVRKVDETAVDRVLGGLRDDAAVFTDIEKQAERGDVVLLDSSRLDANGRRLPGSRLKGRRIPLGSADVLPDLENALLGSKAGQERTFEIRYPADYPVPELAGSTQRYVVNVRKIQEKKLRDLDDNLAREVFGLGSLEELRSRIRLNLEGEERVREQRELESALVTELIRRNSFELPEGLVQSMLRRVIDEVAEGRQVSEALRKELEQRHREGIERSLRREILLGAVARQEKLEVSEQEVGQEIDRLAQADPRQAARVRARYLAPEARQGLKETLLERKALEWLVNAAEVRDEKAEVPLVVPVAR